MNTKRIGLILGPHYFLATRLFFRPEGLSEEADAILGSLPDCGVVDVGSGSVR
ncbi:MAG: hypothetical protein IPN20_12875 [Haliscomenobacter sp.]|nr:hypothetical protein [Haliscomenobacter sp.]